MKFVTTQRQGVSYRYLLRGDSEGYVLVWNITDITEEHFQKVGKISQPIQVTATYTTSLTAAWGNMHPRPVGILDQVEKKNENCNCSIIFFLPIQTILISAIKLTASIYLPLQSRLVVGREDGSIIIIPATQTVMLQLLHGNHQQYDSNTFWGNFQLFA